MQRIIMAGGLSVVLYIFYSMMTYRMNIPFYLSVLVGIVFFLWIYVMIEGIFKE